jgi:uncharacterized protein YraI
MPHPPLPRVYGRHRWLAYWYIPAAVVVAAAVAGAVIWTADRLTGDGSTEAATTSADGTATAAAGVPTSAPTVAATPPPGVTPQPTAAAPTPSPAPAGKFAVGDIAVVTGAGDCLNVRVAAGTQNDAIVCLPDGSEVEVRGGPEQAGGLTWWLVLTRLGEGWSAEDYLVKK